MHGRGRDVPFGNLTGLLKTKDFTRLEPKADEHKYYKRGVGVGARESACTRRTPPSWSACDREP